MKAKKYILTINNAKTYENFTFVFECLGEMTNFIGTAVRCAKANEMNFNVEIEEREK